ncbi:TetR/AcrR family transcriptional regulator [Corynebacterium tuscaniense]|uniref:TetR/AcrR family transcriptional regulator n=1 Tax=Corynebacterium tuscaniense TaxID=302449 RepID=UPI00123B836B|nr:TetR family transcriptional regulator [Corynebacterium tuscaniense]KAA8732337.1 TetR family transcriptional regulator [Corynebacterium tuscaniense]
MGWEEKRRATRLRIVESAARLVEKHGFDDVTVEDICAGAGISRRTFFNYMKSKDEAVLGPAPLTVCEEGLRRIAETQSDNLVDLIISVSSVPEGALPDQDAFARRRTMFAENPTLASLALARRRTVLTAIAEALAEHFTRFPEDRRAPKHPVETEIQALIELVQAAVSITAFQPGFFDPDLDLRDNVRNAATFIADYARTLEW